MEIILEYVEQHYILFLIIFILILLAIVGYFAEKKYFANSDFKKEEPKKLDNLKFNDVINQKQTSQETLEQPVEIKNEPNVSVNIEKMNKNTVDKMLIQNEQTSQSQHLIVSQTNLNNNSEQVDEISIAEENFNKISEEIDTLLPEKEFINVDLLDDIDELELGKTQKIDLNLVPDLDDIDLPKIKKLVDEEQDIWR